MEQRRSLSFLCSLIVLSLLGLVEAYKNYTVGDTLGWYDNLRKPNINYQKWVLGKNFSLGDFLIFETDTNHSIIQTYNLTTYKRCDYNNAEDDDTVKWSDANPSAITPHPVSVSIPLVKEGMTYFFSGDYDGEQCRHGQHFKINVSHGQGLPISFKNPYIESPAPTSPDHEYSTPKPDNSIISSTPNNPKESGDDSGSSTVYMRLLDMKLHGVLVLSGFIWIFC